MIDPKYDLSTPYPLSAWTTSNASNSTFIPRSIPLRFNQLSASRTPTVSATLGSKTPSTLSPIAAIMAPLLSISIAPNEVTPLSTKTAASILHFTSRLVVFSISKVLLLVDVPLPTEMDIEPSSMPLSEIWPETIYW
ncbi:hypothetical protein Scep_009929 [Stephania cephalantha]|uniref:Uncharacterized protein n=1 Tax=Stephania cephalantha TaxID=152367 RepID=A0AAP0JU25_9MAGN